MWSNACMNLPNFLHNFILKYGLVNTSKCVKKRTSRCLHMWWNTLICGELDGILPRRDNISSRRDNISSRRGNILLNFPSGGMIFYYNNILLYQSNLEYWGENSPVKTISCSAIVDSLVLVFPRGIRARAGITRHTLGDSSQRITQRVIFKRITRHSEWFEPAWYWR